MTGGGTGDRSVFHLSAAVSTDTRCVQGWAQPPAARRVGALLFACGNALVVSFCEAQCNFWLGPTSRQGTPFGFASVDPKLRVGGGGEGTGQTGPLATSTLVAKFTRLLEQDSPENFRRTILFHPISLSKVF